jgi:hypothetical protein
VSTSPRQAVLALAACALAASAAAGPTTEVYGRPLRGLTLVPVEALLRDAPRYVGRSVRIRGVAQRPSSGPALLKDGDAMIELVTPSFSLPPDVAGSKVAAEGQVRPGDKLTPARFVADGVEVIR